MPMKDRNDEVEFTKGFDGQSILFSLIYEAGSKLRDGWRNGTANVMS